MIPASLFIIIHKYYIFHSNYLFFLEIPNYIPSNHYCRSIARGGKTLNADIKKSFKL